VSLSSFSVGQPADQRKWGDSPTALELCQEAAAPLRDNNAGSNPPVTVALIEHGQLCPGGLS